MSEMKPSPQTTLVILLGASTWPFSSLQNSQAFARSANRVRDYFSNQFELPSANWLDLFDTNQKSPNEVDQSIGDFLDKHIPEMKQTGTPARDLLFYYIGHGVFASDSEQAYHLAIRSTRDENIGASAFGMASLAHTLKTKARYLRRIVILDCCFAAEAFKYMQSAPDQVAIQQTKYAFEEKSKGSGFPKKGTALFCSSGHKTPSLILEDESGTMFSEAFVRALSLGKTYQTDKTHLSLYDLKQSTIDILGTLAEKNAPTPEIHSPDQSEGDVASIPFFPNPRAKEERSHQEKTFLNEEQRPASIKVVQQELQQIREAASSPSARKRADAYTNLLSLMAANPNTTWKNQDEARHDVVLGSYVSIEQKKEKDFSRASLTRRKGRNFSVSRRTLFLNVGTILCSAALLISSSSSLRKAIPDAHLKITPLAEQSAAWVLSPELVLTDIHAQRIDDPNAPIPYQVVIQVSNLRQDTYLFIQDIYLVFDQVTPAPPSLNVWESPDSVRYPGNDYRAVYLGQKPGEPLRMASIPSLPTPPPVAVPPRGFEPGSHVELQPGVPEHLTLILYSHVPIHLQFHLQISYSVGQEEKTSILSSAHSYEVVFSTSSNWHEYERQGGIYIQKS